MVSRVGGFLNPAAVVPAPEFGGIPNPGGGSTGNCSGADPAFLECGTGFGDSGVGVIRCCTQLNFDMGIIKNTRVGGLREDANLQFRAEFYNLFNHAQFNLPVNDRNTSDYGEITSSSVPGRIMQFGLKYTF